MEKSILLHSTPLDEFRDIIGEIVAEKLKQFKPEPAQKDTTGEYLTRLEVCELLKISLTTLHTYTVEGTVRGYRIGGRILYKTDEVNDAVHEIQTLKYKHGRV